LAVWWFSVSFSCVCGVGSVVQAPVREELRSDLAPLAAAEWGGVYCWPSGVVAAFKDPVCRGCCIVRCTGSRKGGAKERLGAVGGGGVGWCLLLAVWGCSCVLRIPFAVAVVLSVVQAPVREELRSEMLSLVAAEWGGVYCWPPGVVVALCAVDVGRRGRSGVVFTIGRLGL
jgi:hypothetical protein